MELTFKNNTVEFEVTGDFNLHIERDERGDISIYQKTCELGEYALNTPKYIVWCMGMNNKDTETSVNADWNSTFNALKDLCEANGIELILSTIPTVKGGYVEDTNEYNLRIHKFKNAIVRSSGLRYIDFDKAVGANEETGEWYGDMLYTDGVHPAADGARALFMQAIADFPELMSAENY